MPSTGDIVRASDFEAIKPQLSIGSVTTGAAGSNASASITGTSPNFKLNLTIPRGNTGATGPQGPSGTYTGPLKPTTSYWRGAIYTSGSTAYRVNVSVPSGGTWAYYVSSVLSGTVSPTNKINVASGGTVIWNVPPQEGSTDLIGKELEEVLCWRIQ